MTSLCIGLFENEKGLMNESLCYPNKSIIYHQDGGGRITSVETVIYVMLEIPKNYQNDVNNLEKEFKKRYDKSFWKNYDFDRPHPRHITIAQADLILNENDLKKISKKMKRKITLQKLYSNNKVFQELTQFLEEELEDYMTDILIDQFENLPHDTTASCYPSRYNIYSKFLVVQYKPDLGFHAIIVPAIRDGLKNFFRGMGKIRMGRYYQDIRNVMLHISFARQKNDTTPNKRYISKIQSNNRNNEISPKLARNFVISYDILDSFKNPVWISLGSYGNFR